MSEVSLIAFQHAKAERVQDLEEEIKSLITKSRSEIGCVFYEVYRDKSGPNKFIFHEKWTSQADIDAHFNSLGFQSFWEKRMDYLTKDVEIHFLDQFS